MKIRKSLRKVGAVAGSALMVGMTLGAAQTLGDFPQPFVTDDGQVQSQVVVGSGGMQADVVGAINIAGAVGNAAVETEERTETVAGAGAFGWTASGGTTLDTVNDNIYFNDNLDTVRDTLTADHVDSLADVTFQDDAGTETDIEFFLYPDNQQIQFGQPQDRNNQDPVLYVDNPASPTSTDYLFRLQANMEDDINFTDPDVQDEEINLFGDTWTVSVDSTASELHLLGSQTTVDVNTGESSTVTVGGSEATIEAVAANDADTASFRVDGQLYEKNEEQTINVNGETLRLDEVIQTGGSGSAQGVLQFAIGSDEYVFTHGNKIEDGDGDDIDGTYVEFDSDSGSNGRVDDVSSMDVYLGAEDDDSEYLMAGTSFTHALFEDYEVHLGGLNPDGAGGPGENVDEIQISSLGDDTAVVAFTSSGGDTGSVEFAHNASGTLSLADDDGDTIHVVENVTIQEDEYFVSDAGDFAHLWEVTNIDRDTDNATADITSSDDATIDLRDIVSGGRVEVNLDAEDSPTNGANPDYTDSEVIDGQTYHFKLDGSSSGDLSGGFRVVWGAGSEHSDGASAGDSVLNAGDEVSVYAPLDGKSGEAIAFTAPATLPEFPAYTHGISDFNTSFVSQDIMGELTDNNADADTEWVNISGQYHIENVSVAGSDNGAPTPAAYSVWADKANTGTSGNVTVNVNSSGWATIDLGVAGAANVTRVAINQSRGSGDYTFSTSGTLAATGTNTLSVSNVTHTDSVTLELPSTESTDAKTTIVDLQQSFSSNVTNGNGGESVTSADPVTVGQQQYTFTSATAHQDNGPDGQIDINLYDGTNAVTDPSLLVVEPEDDNDNEHAYTVTPSYDGGDQEVDVRSISAYTGSTRSTASLESDDDITAGYDFFGTHTLEDSDGQGSVTFHVPSGQAAAGAAVTSLGGSLIPGGGGGSVTYTAVSGFPSLPDVARLDTDTGESVRSNNHLILVGGPAVNTLVADLAADNDDVWSTQDWRDNSAAGNARLNLVNDAFASGQDALIVAGFAADDTRGAARYIANYQDNQDNLAGQNLVSLTSDDYPG